MQRSSFQTSFGQTIVVENGIPGGEYTGNGSWQFQIPEAYESPLMSGAGPSDCTNCSANQSIYWRRGDNPHTLCNGCTYSRQARPKMPKNKPQVVSARKSCGKSREEIDFIVSFTLLMLQPQANRRSGVVCANCKTSTTTLWRRNNQGEPVCNACGLYFKLHNVNRPQSMKKDGIQTRKRKPKYSLQPKPKTSPHG